MSKEHKVTYQLIFTKPVPKNLLWDDFMSMLQHIGAEINTKSGSAVGVKLNGVYAVFHRPHPQKTIYQSDIKRICRFLLNAGISEV